ncbi:MAG: Fe-S-cluster-containing hydrogenase [Proteobacteria bacterium]|nr:Fe-S-cluster-containing hydrogenase [Pseudomonadota bacterium]
MTTPRVHAPAATAEGNATAPRHWRSLNAEGAPIDPAQAAQRDEFPPNAAQLDLDHVGRRDFLGVMGASLTLAGATLSGCVRKPRELILPFNQRPEDLVPGQPRYYATAAQLTGGVVGLLVESQDGRPTKIEGHPDHPMSRGATDTFLQASVLDLYDPQRLRRTRLGDRSVSTRERDAALAGLAARLERQQGRGLALLLQDLRSPTLHALLGELRARYPHARLYVHDAAQPRQSLAGAALVGLKGARPCYALDRADVVLALDADPLGLEGDVVRQARAFAQRRRLTSPRDGMNRLYVVEPAFTVTGMNADNRLRLAASQVGGFLADLVAKLAPSLPAPAGAEQLLARLRARAPSAAHQRWIGALAEDLLAHRGRALIIVGEGQPPLVHALGQLTNALLGSVGQTVSYYPDLAADCEGIEALAAALRAETVSSLVIVGGNPVYDAPADLEFGTLLRRVPSTIYLCPTANETAALARWVVPQSHFLEAWGDLRAADGTISVQQPLIAPLFASLSPIELVARLIASKLHDGYTLLRRPATAAYAGLLPAGADEASHERRWRALVHDGQRPAELAALSPTYEWQALATQLAGRPAARPTLEGSSGSADRDARTARPQDALDRPAPTDQRLELVFQLDATLYDGRFAGNAWLQELPDPVTKLTWDNAALIGAATARRLGLKSEELIELEHDGRRLQAAVWITPGVAESCVALALGYGRQHSGPVADGRGFNANALRTVDASRFAQGVRLRHLRGHYALACTQDHGTLIEPLTGQRRPIVQEATLAQYQRDPDFARAAQLLPDAEVKTLLWEPPNPTTGRQWGMTIDLSSCIGCNACTIACQSENTIPVVGKERVLNGREMHWIRLDRYFSGESDDALPVTQPMACQHCETAPCESVCPVGATAHSPEGLNDMAYNRCIGTRYCANNCPYKVRRFNFFNYQAEHDRQNALLAMQRNPDVTVRFRGVMEKCTYCVQRINGARLAAKAAGSDTIADGTVVPACQQVCPTEAIVFGDLNDPRSRVAQLKQRDRNYAVLGDMNLKPRTTYLARVRNPNPKLG